ncbi:MAG TPA: YetF domain-containing protein [Candidatus Thermoplasmatota archaeon]|nr:YetF domain-containing protein [Candidatus Thermoplasmatota archaeon]
MDLVVRAAVIFAVLFLLMRVAGNRQFSEMTAFDAILVIVIAEVTGNSLSGQDYSLTASIVVIVTLVSLDILISWLKARSRRFDRLAEGVPVLILENGRLLEENMKRERVDSGDILEAARSTHGLERLDQIRYAILEKGGSISIIPKSGA